MSEHKTVFRWMWVWDFEKEELWLNEMAQSGWLLEGVGICVYRFVACEPGEYTVRMVMHRPDAEYIGFMQDTGAEYVGRTVNWLYFRKKTVCSEFAIFSDMDSRIAHLDRIGRMLLGAGIVNLVIGVSNSINAVHIGWINLLCATLLMYALGRIHGKAETLRARRQLQE